MLTDGIDVSSESWKVNFQIGWSGHILIALLNKIDYILQLHYPTRSISYEMEIRCEIRLKSVL